MTVSFASQTGQWTLLAPILPVVVDAAAKSALVLIAAGVAVGCMRKCSAAARHLVWFLAVASLPLLPALSLALPGWHILPRWFSVQPTTSEQRAAPTVEANAAHRQRSRRPVPLLRLKREARLSRRDFSHPRFLPAREQSSRLQCHPTLLQLRCRLPRSIFRLVLPLWITGAALALAPTALGLFSLWRLDAFVDARMRHFPHCHPAHLPYLTVTPPGPSASALPVRSQSRNDQGAETASTWPVFGCSLPMALSCRAAARGTLTPKGGSRLLQAGLIMEYRSRAEAAAISE